MDIFNTVCRDLPEGYLIEIELENGSASMNIVDPKGADIEWHLDDLSFEEQIIEAVKWCVEDSKYGYRPPRYDACYRAGVADLEV